MNREIKFRAWNEVQEKMLNWYEFLDTNMKDTFIAPESTGLILMQYTGLKDKNGVEIYEGDVVYDDFYEKKTTVVFIESAFCLDYGNEFDKYGSNHSRYTHIGEYASEVLEVIGNIYENPELLKESEE